MILFDSRRRVPVAVKGKALRLQQDIERFLADSMYYFDLSRAQLQRLVADADASAAVPDSAKAMTFPE